ncbi:MAG: thiamine ABC transporter substrate binding subunit [Alphaproteobacteria bacterium]|nr:thiamine ABC transporter substrate binding subunit [Alphaproteobacteria bacterium]
MHAIDRIQKFFVFAALFLGIVGIAQAEKPILTVYTYDSFASEWGPGPKVAESFEAQCDCVVKYVATADSVAMFSKVLLEGKNTKADVLMGLDTNLAARARDSGLFAKHNLIPLEALSLPISWHDPYFAPFDWGVMAFIYNREAMPNPPTSFAELQNLPEEVKIVVQDPRTSTPGYALLLWLETLYPNNADEVWRNLRPNILTFTKGWWEAYSMYLQGQADMVLSYTTSPAYHMIAESVDKHHAALFAEGHIAQIELAGIIANTEQFTLAQRFLQHMQSREVQSIIPTTNWMFPIRDDIELPDAFAKLIAPENIFIADPDSIEALRKPRLQRWQAAVQ